jgi:single-stranded-DNA-specific exonuclease
MLKRFGGHAAAAGLTINEDDLSEFEAEFEAVARHLIPPDDLQRALATDGPLESGYRGIDTARLLQGEIWGQGFPAPIFSDVFEVRQQRLLKDKHLKLSLHQGGATFAAIRFNNTEPAPRRIQAAYRLDINEWNGVASVQLLIEDFAAA